MRRQGIQFGVCVVALLICTGTVAAQERALVFLHGVNATPETWEGAANRLRQRAMI